MKKHKSVVAILLSVMMIFAMMPTMVFAAGENPVKSWDGATYETAYDSSGTKFATARNFDGTHAATDETPAETGSGVIVAVPEKIASTVEGEGDVMPPEGEAYFYDLTGSSFVYGAYDETTKTRKALDGSAWTQEAFANLAPMVQLVEPSYAYSAADKKNAQYVADKAYKELAAGTEENTYTTSFGTWNLVVERSEYKPGLTTDQTVTFTVKSLAPAGEVDHSSAKPDLTGTVAKATVTVKGHTKKIDEVNESAFHLDAVDGVAINAGTYDGAAHTVVAEEVPGYTVSYQILNPATGKYEAASAVTITDVQKNPIQFKAIFTDAKGVATPKGPYALNLASLKTQRKVAIGWDAEKSAADASFLYLVEGTEYNANDFIAVVAEEKAVVSGETPAQGEARVAMNNAAKSAVTANDAQLKDWFNTYYELKDATTKAAAAKNQAIVNIAAKTLTAAEQKAAEEKFAQLFLNIADNATLKTYVATGSATIQLNADKIDYEIEFTKAPEGAKVIHIKKAKKLKKDKSFTVKAVSNQGVALSYKLINANSKIKINKTTGKITLKKGLKKGTYKFMVKAYVPGYSATSEGFEVQNIVVKIKK